MDHKDALTGARRFAAALDGPFGRRKLQSVVDEHLDFLTRARESGASWPQIAEVLARAGAVDMEGKAIAANALRAMVSRAGRRDEASADTRPGEVSVTNAGSSRRRKRAIADKPAAAVPAAAAASQPNRAGSVQGQDLDEIRRRIRRASSLRGRVVDDERG